jgi:chorismate mutase
MNNDLAKLRGEIDNIDNQITDLLIGRIGVSHQVAELKRSLKIAVRDVKREEELLAAIAKRGKAKGLNEDFLRQLYDLILQESRRIQKELLGHE